MMREWGGGVWSGKREREREWETHIVTFRERERERERDLEKLYGSVFIIMLLLRLIAHTSSPLLPRIPCYIQGLLL